jgi:hypothetical protein
MLSNNTKKTNSTSPATSTIIDIAQGNWGLCYGNEVPLGDVKFYFRFDKNSMIIERNYYASTDGTCQNPTMIIQGKLTYVKGTGETFYPGGIPIDVTFVSPYTVKALINSAPLLSYITSCTGVSNPVANTTYNIDLNLCNPLPIISRPFATGEVLYTEVFVDQTVTPTYLGFGADVSDAVYDGRAADKRLQFLGAPEYLKE